MKILVVSATRLEIRNILDALTSLHKEDDFLSHSRFRGMETDVLITGIGTTATAYHLGRILKSYDYDLVVNAGICGAFNQDCKIGEVVEVTDEIFSNVGAQSEVGFQTLFELDLAKPDDPPYVNGMLVNKFSSAPEYRTGLRKSKGSTSDTMHHSEAILQQIIEKFHPEVESMEGAAFFYSCLLADVPFLSLRSVSNYVGEKDHKNWNIGLAVKNLNEVLVKFFEHLSEKNQKNQLSS
jgi:futalosine hydrolase